MTFSIAITTALTTVDRSVTDPAAGNYRARLLDNASAEISALVDAGPVFTFTGVAEGDYVVEVARLDVNGTVIGTPVTAPVSAKPSTQPVELPGSITVSVTAE